MRHRRFAASVLVVTLAASGLLLAKQTAPLLPPLPPAHQPPPATPELPRAEVLPVVSLPSAPVLQAAPKADDLTIEQLLEAVDRVQAQKAELEKRERELLQALRAKADRLRERLDKLGVGDRPAGPPPLPPAG
jgi:hypothetical protein